MTEKTILKATVKYYNRMMENGIYDEDNVLEWSLAYQKRLLAQIN